MEEDRDGKPPYAIALADRQLMALAGLWETWRSPVGEWVRSFAIITTSPNELCAELHNRMPVVLGPEAWRLWLGEEPAEPRQLKALLAPYPSEGMTCWPVSVRVGNVKNNDLSLIEPIGVPALCASAVEVGHSEAKTKGGEREARHTSRGRRRIVLCMRQLGETRRRTAAQPCRAGQARSMRPV